jgi:hypothetical protein
MPGTYSIDQWAEVVSESRGYLISKARKRFPGLSDITTLERYAEYLEDDAHEWAADDDWHGYRRCRAEAAQCRELIETLSDDAPLSYHRMGQLLSLLRELYTRLWHTTAAGPRTRRYRARLLRVIDTVNERLRETP